MALPPLWKPKRASGAAPGMELLHLHPFGRAPGGAGSGAAAEALPNRATLSPRAQRVALSMAFPPV